MQAKLSMIFYYCDAGNTVWVLDYSIKIDCASFTLQSCVKNSQQFHMVSPFCKCWGVEKRQKRKEDRRRERELSPLPHTLYTGEVFSKQSLKFPDVHKSNEKTRGKQKRRDRTRTKSGSGQKQVGKHGVAIVTFSCVVIVRNVFCYLKIVAS